MATIIASVNGLAGGSVLNLRCEYLENPRGIDVTAPRLSWVTESEGRGWKQSAYRVLVASSEDRLARDEGDLWDSGKVESDRSTHVEYAGRPLASRTQCYWKARAWDSEDEASEWSSPAMWSMGLLKPEAWQDAEWIGWDHVPETKPAPKPRAPKITITKALYGVPGDAAKQVDLTEKIQQLVAAGTGKVKGSNDFAGKDPAPGIKKKLVLEYTLDGKAVKVEGAENEEIDLSTGKGKPEKQYLPAPYLRKEFGVSAAVKRATVYVTAEGFFELHLNGQRVSDEFFMPGWTDYRKRIYYRAYDVTEMLSEGANTIGAILGDGWFRGNISVCGQNQYGKRLRLKTQLHIEYADGETETVVSGSGWKAFFGPILRSDMQDGETYDARRELPGWGRSGFDDSQWAPVDVGSETKALLQAYPGAPVRRTMELPAVELTEPKPGNHVFDLGQNFSGWIRLKVKGKAGDKIVMRFGEMLNADGTVYTANLRSARATDTYILKGGDEEVWEPRFTFHGFRYVGLTGVTGKVTPDTVTGVVIHSDAPIASAFECSNPMLNKLHSNIVWGQRSNYLEVPTDCPQRDERLGWTGDTQVFIRTGCYNQDVSAFFTKWMVDLMDTQNHQGLFGNQAPVFHGHGAAAWACAGVICPWTIYKVYGDTRMIEDNYDAMARYIEACGKDGLGGRKAHTWGDWLAPGPRPPGELISTAYYAYTTSLMAEMAEALGKQEDAAKYRKLFEDIRGYFQKTYVADDGTITSNLQAVYCMALQYNLLTDAQRKQAEVHLVERIKAKDYHLSVGFLGIPILLPALTDMGRSDLAYRLIQKETYPSWGYSIEQGATTIWERWNSYTKDKGFGDVKMNSFNHYALGACGEWMFRSMLGIDSDGIGFRKITMKPELPALPVLRSLGEGGSSVEGGEGITWAKGHYDSILGRIGSSWTLDGDQFSWKITVPPNTTATVHIPAKVTSVVTESGEPASEAEGITFLRMEDGLALFELGSGTYAFESELSASSR